MKIPKIIHQMWSGLDGPLPHVFKELSATWINNNSEWEYVMWNHDKMNQFVQDFYPQHWDAYNKFPYNIQRWDSIRYLILYEHGGLYTDLDSECFKPIDPLLENRTCCFSMEPEEHFERYERELFFNNALMASIPKHPFMKEIIDKVFEDLPPKVITNSKEKAHYVLNTTGPMMLVDLFLRYENKANIYLIPSKYTSPLNNIETRELFDKNFSQRIQDKMNQAYSVHYFFNTWLKED